MSTDGAIMAVRVDVHGGAWVAGSPTKVVEGPYAIRGNIGARTYDVSSDGQRFLVVKPPTQAAPRIVLVQHWTEELKRLAPVN